MIGDGGKVTLEEFIPICGKKESATGCICVLRPGHTGMCFSWAKRVNFTPDEEPEPILHDVKQDFWQFLRDVSAKYPGLVPFSGLRLDYHLNKAWAALDNGNDRVEFVFENGNVSVHYTKKTPPVTWDETHPVAKFPYLSTGFGLMMGRFKDDQDKREERQASGQFVEIVAYEEIGVTVRDHDHEKRLRGIGGSPQECHP